MADHIVKSYDEQLTRLRDTLLRIGGIVENALAEAINALTRRDAALASEVVHRDAEVDALHRSVEDQAVRLLALRQPMANDLRMIVGAIRIALDLERVGDYAANIAKRVMVLSQLPSVVGVGSIQRMSRIVQEMLKDTLDALGTNDAAKAHSVWQRDEQVDEAYNAVFRSLLTYMMEDPRNITPCAHLLFVAKNIERIGDHATNVAETIRFIVLGEEAEADRPKGDESAFAIVEPPAGP
ncbi:phosphate signaling complex protein PhoU [Elioraea sp. Yellowstone]|jgi:phosphate transport system protein|uniref:phosphate signaling complex protein PhoU n=1 Tax=Elioraea sp. Yellowstone TaxID=2592070 RepID=UPI001153B750|nr:phosphate signaling complex protein PhoU [Elioraea sp. Yellowstone]TQF77077.1 phosphate signaling complex protein PhoU [Elioraea sp. Yellowstone]